MKPPVRPPRLRCGLFPSMYLPHLLVLPATFGLQRFLPPYPYFPALYVISVRQVRGLPAASSRFHLAMDTLAVQLCASSLPTRTRDFHPLEPAHGGRTKKGFFGMKNPFDSLHNSPFQIREARRFPSGPIDIRSMTVPSQRRDRRFRSGCSERSNFDI